MDGSIWQRLGPQGMTKRTSSQPGLTRGELLRMRGLYLVYPIVAVLLVLTVGVPAGRLVVATGFFAAWGASQFLTLSPLRRRQVVGMKSAIDVSSAG